jgi:hypothetical protein
MNEKTEFSRVIIIDPDAKSLHMSLGISDERAQTLKQHIRKTLSEVKRKSLEVFEQKKAEIKTEDDLEKFFNQLRKNIPIGCTTSEIIEDLSLIANNVNELAYLSYQLGLEAVELKHEANKLRELKNLMDFFHNLGLH